MTTQSDILIYIIKGYKTETELAGKLNKTKQAVSKALRRLVKKGLVTAIGNTTNRYYELSKDTESVQSQTSKAPILNEAKTKPSKQRLHRLKRSIERISEYQHIAGAEPIPDWKNNRQETFSFEGLTVRQTENLVVVEGIQLLSDYVVLSEDLRLYGEKQADATFLHLEQKYALQLKWGTERTTIMEHGFTQQEYIKNLKDEGLKGIISFYENSKTGDVEVWGDLSFTELETRLTKHAIRIRALIKPVIDGLWDPSFQLQENAQTIEALKLLKEGIQEERQWFRHHDEQIIADKIEKEALTKLINILTQRLNDENFTTEPISSHAKGNESLSLSERLWNAIKRRLKW